MWSIQRVEAERTGQNDTTTREVILRENAERKAEKEANKAWLQKHWIGVSIVSIGVFTTVVVGMAAFMIFKWPKGIVGSQGACGIAGKDGRKVYFFYTKRNNTDSAEHDRH
jgi:hypothetical protein